MKIQRKKVFYSQRVNIFNLFKPCIVQVNTKRHA